MLDRSVVPGRHASITCNPIHKNIGERSWYFEAGVGWKRVLASNGDRVCANVNTGYYIQHYTQRLGIGVMAEACAVTGAASFDNIAQEIGH